MNGCICRLFVRELLPVIAAPPCSQVQTYVFDEPPPSSLLVIPLDTSPKKTMDFVEDLNLRYNLEDGTFEGCPSPSAHRV